MDYIKAFILSIIQSITEFVPVSSTAHLVVLKKYLNFNINDGGLFEISIQLASIIAVCIFYKKKLLNIAFNLNKIESQKFTLKFILAFLPCVPVGLFLYKYVKLYMHSNLFIAASLIIGGIILFLIENISIKQKYQNIDDVDAKSSFKIGLCQVLSIIPGVSRSGSTIAGGLAFGLSRKTAVEFSFILAIPTILSATLIELIESIKFLNAENINIILFGFISTFIFSMIIIEWFLNYISEHNLKIFAYYRIIFGTILILLSR